MNAADISILQELERWTLGILRNYRPTLLPDLKTLDNAAKSIKQTLPSQGIGSEGIARHLIEDIAPGLNESSLSPNYYGFVTGGITPAARIAESIVSLFDQNVSVHLPQESVATIVEDRALSLLLQLFDLNPAEWPERILTTGATASNVVGLACGREFLVSSKLAKARVERQEGEGLLTSCLKARIEKFQILTTMPHSSLGKAANIVGLGSASMIDVSRGSHHLHFDLEKLERFLSLPMTASIVALSGGEVNTGEFATSKLEEVRSIRRLCDKYGAWLHIDGAFGLFARALPATTEYDSVRSCVDGLELVDSICGDGHKLLNVPYDCGFFFCRHQDILPRVFGNTNAAYLKSNATDDIQSPLNLRLENSARFRGLPVYATLLAYGKEGYGAMVSRMVDLARKIAAFIQSECTHLELLPQNTHKEYMELIFMIVLFRARDENLNESLAEEIKASGKVYASGTVWEGKPAVRFAIAKWDIDVEKDFAIVKDVLMGLA